MEFLKLILKLKQLLTHFSANSVSCNQAPKQFMDLGGPTNRLHIMYEIM